MSDSWNHKKKIEKKPRTVEETFETLEEMAVFGTDPPLHLASPKKIINCKKKKQFEELTEPPRGKEG